MTSLIAGTKVIRHKANHELLKTQDTVAQRIRASTTDPRVVGSNLTWGKKIFERSEAKNYKVKHKTVD